MTNEEILIQRGSQRGNVDAFPLSYYLDLARADEREKLKDQIPKEGSGPWAVVQHWAGKPVMYCQVLWAPECDLPSNLHAGCLLVRSGWSVVPAEVKPMTFAEACCFRGTGRIRSEFFCEDSYVAVGVEGTLIRCYRDRPRHEYCPTVEEVRGQWFEF